MSLSTEDLTRLSALRAAYDKLITGQRVVRVGIGGKLVEYGAGDIGHLKSEIDRLEARNIGKMRGALCFRVL